MNISQIGINLIKDSEGYRPLKYICPGGKPTIGWGHQITVNEKIPDKISLQEAIDLLNKDIQSIEYFIHRVVKVPLKQGQFDALVSLIFNWGEKKFLKSEGLEKLNQGDYNGAISEFNEVIRAKGKILPGLVKRRAAEEKLWNGENDL